MSSLETTAGTFCAAADMFSALVSEISDQQLDDAGLGEWTVRDLIGHTLRAVLTVETYLATPAEEATQHTPGGYFHAGRSLVSSSQVADRGRLAGQALGDDPAAAVAQAVGRIVGQVHQLADAGDDPLVTTAVGGMRLSAYLPTRTLELVIHSVDLAKATDRWVDVPADAMRQTLEVLGSLAVLDGRGADVAFALTGRSPLRDGFDLLA